MRLVFPPRGEKTLRLFSFIRLQLKTIITNYQQEDRNFTVKNIIASRFHLSHCIIFLFGLLFHCDGSVLGLRRNLINFPPPDFFFSVNNPRGIKIIGIAAAIDR